MAFCIGIFKKNKILGEEFPYREVWDRCFVPPATTLHPYCFLEESKMSKRNETPVTESKEKSLVKVKQRKIGKNFINAVDARELHEYLDVNSQFRDWIRNRIKAYFFEEKKDFVTFAKNLANGGRTKEYAISIDMAKELCMVEKNEKGKQARQYFIECERKVLEREREKVRKLSNHVPKPEINQLEALRRENKDLRTHLENYIYLFNTLRKMYETCRDDMNSYREESYKYRRKWLEDRIR